MGNIAGDILLLLSIDPVYTQGTPFILGGEISNIIESLKKKLIWMPVSPFLYLTSIGRFFEKLFDKASSIINIQVFLEPYW